MRENLMAALFWIMATLGVFLYAKHAHAEPPEIFDSRTMRGESFLLMDDCFVPLKTAKIKDDCYVQRQIEKECGIKDAMGAVCGKK